MNLLRRSLNFQFAVAAVIALSAVLGATCDPNGDDSAAETPSPVAGAPTQSPTAPPAPSPTPLPTATPTPAPLSGAEIFSRVSPNVPIVITGSGLGSGVLIPGGFIVTNAHVVWGYPNVLVKFPNSDTHRTLPVVGLDLMADLAVIGPVNVLLEGLDLRDGEDLAIGSDVYLVGYPDEVEVFPDKPTISRGVISRFRQWRALDLTLIQSDAATGGGQSGGVMVSENGDVIGITTRTFGDGRFIIATSAADILERVASLTRGEDVDGLRDRRLPSHGATEQEFTLTDRWHSKIAVLYEREDTEVKIRLESETDSAFAVADISGDVILDVDDSESGVEWGSTTLETLGPHFVLFEQFSSEPGEFVLETSHDFGFIVDKDDHRRVSVEESVVGNVDAPLDEDYFELQLEAGESVTVRAESFMIDPYVRVVRADWATAAVSDDDGGGGVVGEDAFVSFTAPESGIYIILVSDSWDTQFGGYFLRIDWAPRRAVSPLPTETPAIPAVPSPHGLMATYSNVEYDFSIQYPADWTESKPDDDYATRLESGDGGFLTINIEELTAAETDDSALDDFVDRLVSWIESAEQGGRVHTHAEYGYVGGKPAQLVSYTLGGFDGARLSFFSEQGIAFVVAYEFHEPPTDEVARMVEYSFGTLTVVGQRLTRLTDVPEFPSLAPSSSDDTQLSPDSSLIQSPFGPIATYRDDEFAFSIQYLADWEVLPEDGVWKARFLGGEGAALGIGIQDFADETPVSPIPEQYHDIITDWIIEHWRPAGSGHRILPSSDFGVIDDRPVHLTLVTTLDGRENMAVLTYLSATDVFYLVAFQIPASGLDQLVPVFDHLIRSITVDGNPLIDAPEFPSMQTAPSADAQPASDSADAQNSFGPMATYSDHEVGFTIKYPAGWYQIAEAGDPGGVQFSNLASGASVALLGFWTVQLSETVQEDLALDWYIEHLVTEYVSKHDAQAVSNSRYGEINGRPAQIVVFRTEGGVRYLASLLYASENLLVYNITYVAHVLRFEEFVPLFEYSFRSVTIDGKSLVNTPEFPSVP